MQHDFKKQFGQNFLQHAVWVEKLIDAADLTKNDQVLEIGPGAGVVTDRLSQEAGQVTALEIDSSLIPYLEEQFTGRENLKIVNQDVLQWNMNELKAGKYKIVASLPYNISKKIINKFITAVNPPKQMALLIQKEVAYDYVAKAPDATFLGTIASIYADIELTTTVPAHAFFPVPKVDGGVLKFTNIKPKLAEPEALIKFIRIGYSAPRKKLSGNLANLGHDKAGIEAILTKLGLSATARAQELDLPHWQKLFTAIQTTKK